MVTKIPIGQQIILTECFPELDKLEPVTLNFQFPNFIRKVYISYTFCKEIKLKTIYYYLNAAQEC